MSDNSERFKGFVHFAIFSLVSMAAGYNLMQYGAQKDLRHLANATVYAPLAVFEVFQIIRHLKVKRD